VERGEWGVKRNGDLSRRSSDEAGRNRKKKRTAEPQNVEPQKSEVKIWNSDSALHHSAVLRFDILRFAVSESPVRWLDARP
jgi:hypothetical protein